MSVALGVALEPFELSGGLIHENRLNFNHLRNPYKIGKVLRFGKRRAERTSLGSFAAASQSSDLRAKARRYWASLRVHGPARMLFGEQLAEGVRLGSNGL